MQYTVCSPYHYKPDSSYSFNPLLKSSKEKSLQVSIDMSVPNDNCKKTGYQLLSQNLPTE